MKKMAKAKQMPADLAAKKKAASLDAQETQSIKMAARAASEENKQKRIRNATTSTDEAQAQPEAAKPKSCPREKQF